jgi:hypothetical protein
LPELPPRSSFGPFGPEGPLWVGATAPNGQWTVVCDAKEKTAPTATLHVGTKPGLPITALLASSTDSRYVVIARNEQWTLLDTRSDYRVELNTKGIDRRVVPGDVQALALDFHPTKPLVALIVERPEGRVLSLIALDRNEETPLASLPETPYRVRWAPNGEALYLDETPMFEARPKDKQTPPGRLCQTPEPFFLVFPTQQRPNSRFVVTETEKQLLERPGLLLRTTKGDLVLSASRRVILHQGKQALPLSPKDCEAYSLGTHSVTSRVLVGCSAKGRMRLGLVSADGYVPLDLEIPSAFDLEARVVRSKYLPIYSGNKSVLVDFEKKRLLELRDKDQLLAQDEDQVLLKRERAVLRRNVHSGVEQLVVEGLTPGARVLFAPGFAYVAPYIIAANPNRGQPVRTPPGVLALSREGCVLVAASPADPPHYAIGPLRWFCND